MAAEIKIRLEQYADALNYINKVRERAGYKDGEAREKYVDGAQSWAPQKAPWSSFYGRNTYYLSNNITETTAATDITVADWTSLPAVAETIIKQLGYTNDFDRMMCFLLNERTRELAGEIASMD